MQRCPFAVQRILPENSTARRIIPVLIIDHTQAGSGSLYNYWLNGTSLESTFWVGLNGTIEQYMDVGVAADANYKANIWYEGGRAFGAVSIETENSPEATYAAYKGGQGAGAFDRDPWTEAQLVALDRLHRWIADTHGIRRQRASHPLSSTGGGLGYHVQFGAPSAWTNAAGKICPGGARIRQWHERLLPSFSGNTPPIPVPVRIPPDPTLRVGNRGAPVAVLQESLNKVVAGLKLVVDGDFGGATEQGVVWFQRPRGLVDDGIYGPMTATALRGAMTPTPEPIPPPVRVIAPPAPLKRPNQDRVAQLQWALNFAAGAQLSGTANFDDPTENAVSNLQAFFGLPVNGEYREAERDLLQLACDLKESGLVVAPSAPLVRPNEVRVAELQWALNFGAGARLVGTGVFDGPTWQAVKSLQTFFRIPVSGDYGPKTQALLQLACDMKRG